MKRRNETLIAAVAIACLIVISVIICNMQKSQDPSSYKPEVRECETHGQQIEFMDLSTGEGQDCTEVYHRQADLIDTASDVLTTYKDMKTCALGFNGYLDLMGKQWACVIHGGSWVDCVFIHEITPTTTEVTTLRFSSEDLRWKEIVDVWLGEVDS